MTRFLWLVRVCASLLLGLSGAVSTAGPQAQPAPAHYAHHARHVARPRLRTDLVTDEEGFENLVGRWDSLLDQGGEYSYFLRAGWNRRWWQHHAPPDSRLHIVTCVDNEGALVGVAPLYARRHRVLGVPCARELLLIGTGITLKTSEHLDIVARPGFERQVAEAIADRLRADPDWDRLWLWQVGGGSVTLSHFETAMGEGVTTKECDRAPFIDTSSDWDTLRRSYGRSMRRNLDYYSRRLFKTHACQFQLVRTREEVEPAMDALVRLHQARWESLGAPGAFRAPGFETFLRAAARDAFESGHLRLWTLRIDGQIEAALIGFAEQGVLHYFQKGFNPAYAKWDLGTAMLALCVRECVADPEIRAFDFMGGGAPYKTVWARQSRVSLTSTISRRTWRNRVHDASRSCVDTTRGLYRRVAPAWFRQVRREWIRRAQLARRA